MIGFLSTRARDNGGEREVSASSTPDVLDGAFRPANVASRLNAIAAPKFPKTALRDARAATIGRIVRANGVGSRGGLFRRQGLDLHQNRAERSA
jgi:hypothetical protein